MRQKWRDIADDITEVKTREISVNDIATFVEKTARAQSHPIFGRYRAIGETNRNTGKVQPKGPPYAQATSFGTKGKDERKRETKNVQENSVDSNALYATMNTGYLNVRSLKANRSRSGSN